MRILPWSLSVPEANAPLIVPRLPFPYMLRTAYCNFGYGSGTGPQSANLILVDGAGGELFRSTSEVWDSGNFWGLVTFAPGMHRGSGSPVPTLPAYTLVTPAMGVIIGTAINPQTVSAQGAIPPDFWIMPSMQLRLIAEGIGIVTASSPPFNAARLIIGIP